MEGPNGDLSQLPREMITFTLKQRETSHICARLGRLLAPGRTPISTPHYVVPTSRGVVPHLAHDMLQKHTNVSAVHIALEDFVEKSAKDAPLFKTLVADNESPLRQYIALPNTVLSILGPRRIPGILCPAQNTNSAVTISTSVGFRSLAVEEYIEACRRLRADISVSLADLVASDRISVKRLEKSADRTHAWLRDTIGTEDGQPEGQRSLFASIPPIEREQQSFYLSDMADDFKPSLAGLSLHSPDTVAAIPGTLDSLPRLCLTDPATPHDILYAISIGIDLITIPFVTQTSEYGMAFSFTFPAQTGSTPEPLALDLWSTSHATSLEPLTQGCTCYTCTRHHRAYIHHLLQAKEMLAWTLLQIHNFASMHKFFANVRESIVQGTFEPDVIAFGRAYEAEMPKQTGQGPRVRGYQVKSVGGGELPKNPKAYGRLDEQLQKSAEAEEGVVRPETPANALQEQGFAAKTS